MGQMVLVTGIRYGDADGHERQFRYLTTDRASLLADANSAVRKAQEALNIAEQILREQCEALGVCLHTCEINPRIYELDVDYASENLEDMTNVIVP